MNLCGEPTTRTKLLLLLSARVVLRSVGCDICDTTRHGWRMQAAKGGKLTGPCEKGALREPTEAASLPDTIQARVDMEAAEIHEFNEQQEEAARRRELFPISFTISVLAVLVAMTTIMGHRAHTAAVLQQARSTDQWNLYQAKKIRDFNTGLSVDLMASLSLKDQAGAAKIVDGYRAHRAKWATELEEEQKVAKEFGEKVEVQERRAARFDLGEALLQIAVVIVSVTLLTRQRAYWFFGIALGSAGLICAALGFLQH